MIIKRPDPRRVVDDELSQHVEMEIRRLTSAGMTREDATRVAHERFGNFNEIRDECRAIAIDTEHRMQRHELFADLRQDLTFAVRTLLRMPMYTTIALTTLCIGIGANTAIFSVIYASLIDPLPYREPARLVTIANSSGAEGQHTAVATAEFADYVQQTRSLDALAAIRELSATVSGGCASETACIPEELTVHAASPNLFDMLGVPAQLGRNFVRDDGTPLPATTAIISDALWHRRYSGDSGIIGRTIQVNGIPRTVVGVASPQMRFPDAPVGYIKGPPDLWLANSLDLRRTDDRGNQVLVVIGRMRPGLSVTNVSADFARIAETFRRDYHDRYVVWSKQWRLAVVPLRDEMFGDSRPMLLTVFGAAALILLMACVNVANLTLARGAARSRELAVRVALGAGRARLVRQLLTESILLALLGGALGTALAAIAMPLLVRLNPGTVPRFDAAHIGAIPLAFSVLVSVLAGVAVGLLPALRVARHNIRNFLSGTGSRTASGAAKSRSRQLLVAAEVAMAVILLVAAGLLVRTFWALARVPTGITSAGVQTFYVPIASRAFDSTYKVVNANLRIVEQLRALPGAEAASGVQPLPFSGEGWSGSFRIEGATQPGEATPHAEYSAVLPEYFRTMGISLLEGRDVTLNDRIGVEPVVIVDADLAKRYWPGETAIGKRINRGGEGSWMTVVGVVAHVRRAGPRTEGEPQIYLPLLQNAQPMTSFVVRGAASANFASQARDIVAHVSPNLVVSRVQALDQLEKKVVARERFNLALFASFGFVALILATVGLYGVTSYLVTQRTQEIAIRMALGGQQSSVMRLVLTEAVGVAFVGLAVGMASALLVNRLLVRLLYGVTGTDPMTYGAIALVLTVVGLAAAWVPGRRATRINPINALRG